MGREIRCDYSSHWFTPKEYWINIEGWICCKDCDQLKPLEEFKEELNGVKFNTEKEQLEF